MTSAGWTAYLICASCASFLSCWLGVLCGSACWTPYEVVSRVAACAVWSSRVEALVQCVLALP
eukprot:scaffold160591_cov26-Tisochrysis_lutea.AAC.4